MAMRCRRAYIACSDAIMIACEAVAGMFQSEAPQTLVVAALGTLCLFAMAAIVLFDAAVRLIPRRLCWMLAASGAGWQFCRFGFCGMAAGAFWAAVFSSLAALFAIISCFVAKTDERPLGGGDVRCMVALSLATGSAAPIGFAACFVAAALWSGQARIRKRLLPKEPFAFAPFLAIWLVAGFLVLT